MKINIISVGKIKEEYLVDGILEYEKRISRFANVESIVLQDEPNQSDEKKVKKIEAERILNRLPEGYNVVLDLKGESITSCEFAKKIIEITNYHSSVINFIIGGSLGLDESVLSIAHYHLCFSKFTFPHQLMKLILLEQIYRAFKINNNETYHK